MKHEDDILLLKRADILSRMSNAVDKMYDETPGVFYGKNAAGDAGWHYHGLGAPIDTITANKSRLEFLDCIMPKDLFMDYAASYFSSGQDLEKASRLYDLDHGGHPSQAMSESGMYQCFLDSSRSVESKGKLIRDRDDYPMSKEDYDFSLQMSERYPDIERSFHVMLDIMRSYRRDFKALMDEKVGDSTVDHKLLGKADEVLGVAENHEFFHVGVLMASGSEGVRQAAEEGRMDLTGEDLSQGMMRWIYGDNSAFATHRAGHVNMCPFKARFVELWNKRFDQEGGQVPQRGGFFDTVTEGLKLERDIALSHEPSSDELRT